MTLEIGVNCRTMMASDGKKPFASLLAVPGAPALALFLLLVVMHAVQIARIVPPSRFFSNTFILSSTVHARTQVAIHQDRQDPSFALSGAPSEALVAVLLDRVLRPVLSENESYRFFITLVLFLSPFLLYPAALWFGLSWKAALVAVGLGVLGTDGYLHHGRFLIHQGQIAFFGASFLLVLVISAFRAGVSSRAARWVFALGFPFLLLLVPAYLPILLVFLGVELAGNRRGTAALFWPVAAGVAAALALNGFWLRGAGLLSAQNGVPSLDWSTRTLRDVSHAFLFSNNRLNVTTLLRVYTVILACVGLYDLAVKKDGRALSLASVIVAVGFIGFYGSVFPGGDFLLPGRFIFTFFVLLIPLSAAVMTEWLLIRGSRREMFFLWIFWFLLVARLAPFGSRAVDQPSHPALTGFGADIARLPARSGNILVESPTSFDAGRELLALLPGRSFPGLREERSTTTLFGKDPSAGHDTVHLFGEPLVTRTLESTLTAFRNNDVGWVVAVSSNAQAYFDFHDQAFRPVTSWPRPLARRLGLSAYYYRIFAVPRRPREKS